MWEIGPGESGLAQPNYAKTEDVKSISTLRLVRRLGQAPPPNLPTSTRSGGRW